MIWRVLLSAFYACAFGALMTLENFHPEMSDAPLLAIWLAAPIVGILVGRWWVAFAVVGPIVGRAIGWDAGENDGNPALWPPYVVSAVFLVGLPLLLGVGISQIWQDRRRRAA